MAFGWQGFGLAAALTITAAHARGLSPKIAPLLCHRTKGGVLMDTIPSAAATHDDGGGARAGDAKRVGRYQEGSDGARAAAASRSSATTSARTTARRTRSSSATGKRGRAAAVPDRTAPPPPAPFSASPQRVCRGRRRRGLRAARRVPAPWRRHRDHVPGRRAISRRCFPRARRQRRRAGSRKARKSRACSLRPRRGGRLA